MPRLTTISRRGQSLQATMLKTRTQLRDMTRWISFFVLGALGLSLGIAYQLTHLYRIQKFPKYVWFLTLQFTPRPWRGALFIVWGIAVIFVAMRRFLRSTSFWNNPRAS